LNNKENKKKAIESYQMVLKIAPDSEKAKKQIKLLED